MIDTESAVAWQSIQTAPKDGTPMLLHYKGEGVVYGCYDPATGDWWVIALKDTKWRSPYMDREEDPLHWMPIPEPPDTSNVVTVKPIRAERL